MEKQGAYFGYDTPHLNPGAIYYFPGDKNEQKKLKKLLIDKKEELAKKLLPEVKKEIEFFDPNTSSSYPYFGFSNEGITFYINNDGKWFELKEEFGNIVSGHNLDYFVENAIAFNTASKLIELLNPNIDTPKVLHDDNKTLYYPLPNNLQMLPEKNEECVLTQEWVNSLYNHMKLGDTKLILEKGVQKIENSHGKIIIKDGIINAISNQGYKEFSWICSKLLYLTI
ncbi:MAG: hypothetical protein WC812_04850 [Candidatus Pacearchaeota archaeon]